MQCESETFSFMFPQSFSILLTISDLCDPSGDMKSHLLSLNAKMCRKGRMNVKGNRKIRRSEEKKKKERQLGLG